MIQEFQNLFTLIATATGVYVAVGGLHAWRRETIGKRDLELCQNVIERFYEAEHKMALLRSPASYSWESEKRPKDGLETLEESNRRDTLYVPLARINTQSQFWSELFSYRFRMRALFGESAHDAFNPIDEAYRSFNAAASVRYQALYINPRGMGVPEQARFEQIIWAGTVDPDPIAEKMLSAVSAMEAICVPIVRSRYRPQRFCEWIDKYRLF